MNFIDLLYSSLKGYQFYGEEKEVLTQGNKIHLKEQYLFCIYLFYISSLILENEYNFVDSQS